MSNFNGLLKNGSKVYGKLLFPEGAQEATFYFDEKKYAIVEFRRKELSFDQKLEHIKGFFNGLGKITFGNCRWSNISSGSIVNNYKCRAQIVFQDHLDPDENDLIKSAIFDLSSYKNWFFTNTIDWHRRDNGSIATIELSDRKEILLSLDNASRCSISFENLFNGSFLECSVEQTSRFEIEFDEAISLNTLYTLKHRLKQVLCVLSGFLYNISYTYIGTRQNDFISLYQRENPLSTDRTFLPTTTHTEIEEHFNDYIQGWLSSSLYGRIGDLLISRYSNPLINPEQDFTNSTFALETLHRMLFPEEVSMDKKIYQQELNKLRSRGKDDQFISLIVSKLGFGYQLSFPKRLKQLNETYNAKNPWTKKFITEIVNQRNNLAHGLNKENCLEKGYFKTTMLIDEFIRDIVLHSLKEQVD